MSNALKTHVTVLYGGLSAEHHISVESANNIIKAINRDKYDVSAIALDKENAWYWQPTLSSTVETSPQHQGMLIHNGIHPEFRFFNNETQPIKIDVAFPIFHGPCGEDGTVQGLLSLLNLPYVGADVLGSAIGMDKDVMKRLLRDADIPTPDFVVFQPHNHSSINPEAIIEHLGLPCFVKPTNMGSSYGITKVKTLEELMPAIEHAFEYYPKVIVERFVDGREFECAVLGNDKPKASIVGEIIPHGEYYTYETKYTPDKLTVNIPAKLPDTTTKAIQTMAIDAFQALCCQGLARIDFFVSNTDQQIYINEINTLPGFTGMSMYPKLWEASGIGYEDLIDRLIQLALG